MNTTPVIGRHMADRLSGSVYKDFEGKSHTTIWDEESLEEMLRDCLGHTHMKCKTRGRFELSTARLWLSVDRSSIRIIATCNASCPPDSSHRTHCRSRVTVVVNN